MAETALETVEILDPTDFSPPEIFDCGQAFRWTADCDGSYTGIAFGTPARVWKNNDTVYILSRKGAYENIWHRYFDMDRDYAPMRQHLSLEETLAPACEFGKGIRILRQEPWEALCSFIISQCNNIPRIRGIVETLCRMCGNEVEFEKKKYFSFPGAEEVARLSENELSELRAGYRAAYIREAAHAVSTGEIDLEKISRMPTPSAKEELLKISGVGEKVASCTLLFGMGKLDAFPVDVWMRRAILEFFGEGDFDYKRFGDYAGLAQQYMFHYMRNRKHDI